MLKYMCLLGFDLDVFDACQKNHVSCAPLFKLFKKMATQYAQVWVGKAGSRGSKAELMQWAQAVGYDRIRSEDHNFDGGGSVELLGALLLFHVLLQGIIDVAMLFVGFCVHDN